MRLPNPERRNLGVQPSFLIFPPLEPFQPVLAIHQSTTQPLPDVLWIGSLRWNGICADF